MPSASISAPWPRAARAPRWRPVVVVADEIAADAVARLRHCCDVRDATAVSREQLAVALGDADALVVRSSTIVDAALMSCAPRLQVIGRAGVGLDNIAVDAAAELGVAVVNSPGSNSVSVAEHTIALMLTAARNITTADESVAAGRWERSLFTGLELSGRRLAVIGLGHVGALVAQRATCFDMRVVGYDPLAQRGEHHPETMEWAQTLEEAATEADVISLHVPLTDETAHMVNTEFLARVRPGAILINTARGGLVDEPALLEALGDGRLAAAALDVFDGEPRPDPALVGHPRVIATPHIAASTIEAQVRAGVMVADEVLRVLASGPPVA